MQRTPWRWGPDQITRPIVTWVCGAPRHHRIVRGTGHPRTALACGVAGMPFALQRICGLVFVLSVPMPTCSFCCCSAVWHEPLVDRGRRPVLFLPEFLGRHWRERSGGLWLAAGCQAAEPPLPPVSARFSALPSGAIPAIRPAAALWACAGMA